MRKYLRGAAVELLSLGERARPAPIQHGQPCHFVYLHSLPENRVDTFSSLLGQLAKMYTFVPYSAAVAGVASGQSQPTMCFSIDDGFRSNLTIADLLERHGTTGCFFIPTNGVGLQNRAAVRAFFGSNEGIEDSTLDWSDLERLRRRGHEIGNHSRDHRVLSELSIDHLLDDLSDSYELLSDRLGTIKHFAWPFGRFAHASPEVVAAAFAAGHKSVASAERGIEPVQLAGNHIIRRDHVDPIWPKRHGLMFIGRSRRNRAPTNPAWNFPTGASS